jgi:hypothetical protein
MQKVLFRVLIRTWDWFRNCVTRPSCSTVYCRSFECSRYANLCEIYDWINSVPACFVQSFLFVVVGVSLRSREDSKLSTTSLILSSVALLPI